MTETWGLIVAAGVSSVVAFITALVSARIRINQLEPQLDYKIKELEAQVRYNVEEYERQIEIKSRRMLNMSEQKFTLNTSIL